MRKVSFILAAAMLMVSAGALAQQASKVYLTREISPESLVKIYKALGVEAKGRVAVKMSTGEGSNPNYLKPELVKNLIWEVDGTIVECNTAYSSGAGNEQDDRNSSANHWKVIERHGFTKYFPVDIMDEYDEIRIPVKDQSHIKYDIVGGHMANYDFMIALNHFKGHPMGGYGGALKNLSIGCASQNGKAYIHSAGKMEKLDMGKLWTPEFIGNQDGFLESTCEAGGLWHPRLYRPRSARPGLHRHHQPTEGDGQERPHRFAEAHRQTAWYTHYRPCSPDWPWLQEV